MSDAPIGLFDSGFGGLTVLKEVLQQLPSEHVIYLGDTANLPYGNKSPEKIRELSFQNAEFLLKQGIKLLIVACHTACSQALTALQQQLPIPVLGVVAPGIEELKEVSQSQRVAVLGTQSTIFSGVYQQGLQGFDLTAIACPLFVPLIEEGFHNTEAAELIAREYLSSVKEKKCDAVLLACTHYPLMRPLIAKILGADVALIEPAKRCAQQTRRLLSEQKRLRSSKEAPQRIFYITDCQEKFQTLGSLFLERTIEKIVLKKTAPSGMIPSDGGAFYEPKEANFTC